MKIRDLLDVPGVDLDTEVYVVDEQSGDAHVPSAWLERTLDGALLLEATSEYVEFDPYEEDNDDA